MSELDRYEAFYFAHSQPMMPVYKCSDVDAEIAKIKEDKICYWYPIDGKPHKYRATCNNTIHAWFGVMIAEIKYCPECGGELNPSPLREAAK